MKLFWTVIGIVACSTLAAGQHINWVKRVGGNFSDAGYLMTSLPDGNLLTTGHFSGLVNFDTHGTDAHLSRGLHDIYVQKLDTNGNQLWVKTFGGRKNDYVYAVQADPSGNILLTGVFEDTINFNSGSSLGIHLARGNSDLFVLKLDQDGNYLWSRSFGSTTYDYGNAIATDEAGNVYIAGTYSGTTNFSTDSINDYRTCQGYADIFILKLNQQGERVWCNTIGSFSGESAASMIVTPTSIVVGGIFSDSINFNPGGVPVFQSTLGSGIFFLKVTHEGTFEWVKTLAGRNTSAIAALYDITTDRHGNIYSTGYFKDSVDFDAGPPTHIVSSIGPGDVFILKMDSSASFLWLRNFGDPNTFGAYGNEIIATPDDRIYTIGVFRGSADFDTGSGTLVKTSNGNYDVFIHKLDENGSFSDVLTFGSTGIDYGTGLVAHQGSVFATGSFSGTVDFEPGPGVYDLTALGSSDIFQLKIGIGVSLNLEEKNTSRPKIYPNPAQSVLFVAGDLTTIRILDMRGAVVLDKVAEQKITQLNLNQLHAGVYIVELVAGDKVTYQKFVLNR